VKPFWRSKKFWTAVVSVVAIIVAEALGQDELVKPIMVLGSTLIGGFGLADFGKEKASLEQVRLPSPSDVDMNAPEDNKEQ
jgi:anti-sigma-K factor RskA